MYSHRPWMPGMSTSGVPWPCSTITRSVPQRLSRLQCVLNPFQCLALAAQLQERLALEIEQVLLGYRGLLRQRSAREHIRERPADGRIVIGDPAGAPREMDAEFQRREHAVAADANAARRRRTLISFVHTVKRELFRIGHQAIAVHRDAIRLPEKSERSCLGGAGRDARKSNRL